MPDANKAHIISFHPKVSAGRGLGMLIAHDEADMEVRRQIILLIGEQEEEIIKAIFISLHKAWKNDVILCWNAFNLCLSLNLIPSNIAFGILVDELDTSIEEEQIWQQDISYEHKERWQRSMIIQHLNNLNQNQLPIIPRITSRQNIVFSTNLVAIILSTLPLPELMQDFTSKQKILQLTDDLIAWTVDTSILAESENSRYFYQQHYFEWNRFLPKWASHLSQLLILEEASHHILNPIRN